MSARPSMTPGARAVTAETLGAWLIKANPDVTAVDDLVRRGFRDVTSRCVTRSYRTGLVAAGQPVLLWVSGNDPRVPAGIHAQGHTTGGLEGADGGTTELVMPVVLEPVDPPVLRAELVGDPALRRIEVVRMPAGSNPSYVTREQLRELAARWPQLTVG